MTRTQAELLLSGISIFCALFAILVGLLSLIFSICLRNPYILLWMLFVGVLASISLWCENDENNFIKLLTESKRHAD